MLWRFWPDRGRLPFFSIHPESSPPEIRAIYAAIFTDASAWTGADARYRFDYVLLDRHQYGTDRLYDRLDADSTWALVFADDAALLYLRRAGAMAAKAESLAYRAIPAGRERLTALHQAWTEDESLRVRSRAELERQARESRFSSVANSLLGDLAMVEGRFPDARAALERALAIDATVPRAYERLGMVAMFEQDMPRAIAAFERQRRVAGTSAALEVELAFARETAGDKAGARLGYLEALRLEPENPLARERLTELNRATPGPTTSP
jgi:tetratricopeptide (TPR) repeat protein